MQYTRPAMTTSSSIVPMAAYRKPVATGRRRSHTQTSQSDELADLWRPYIETTLEAFGVDRSMFESNFPVDRVSCSYEALWNAFKRLTAGASAQEKAKLYRDNARAFYGLD